ncbi:MAG: molybdopterin synthase catalytic subunit [Actinomycetota bacterium]|jgi:molybdopterin synthase catalytic subunit|nr:molybdopterin synthase catalytic subunit [Actinomycetota bacterium]
MGEVIRLLDVREQPLSIDEVFAAVSEAGSGATVLFVGTVRDHDDGKGVGGLGYSAHPTVTDAMRAVAERVAAAHDARALAVVHRVGDLAVGDLAVVVAASCAHRGEAFAAARDLIDDLKATVPIWKHQMFEDGSDEWVGLP